MHPHSFPVANWYWETRVGSVYGWEEVTPAVRVAIGKLGVESKRYILLGNASFTESAYKIHQGYLLELRQAETLLWQSCLYYASISHLSQCISKWTKWPTSFARFTLDWLRRMPLRVYTGLHSYVTKFLRCSFQRPPDLVWLSWAEKRLLLPPGRSSLSRNLAVSLSSVKWKCTFVSFCSACLYAGVVGYCGVRNLVKVESRILTLVRAASSTTLLWLRARNHPPNFQLRTLHWLVPC